LNGLKEDQSFTFIDLFAGIGGIRLALEKNGGKCVFSSEWNKYSRKTYEHNFGDVPAGDITQINAGILDVMLSASSITISC
jgi:DNA (cytosine-5)-methyltransferase 1